MSTGAALRVAVAIAMSSSCGTPSAPVLKGRILTYVVSGTAHSASISYANATRGTTNAKTDIGPEGGLRFSEAILFHPGDTVWISAQNDYDDNGSVVVEIQEDGAVLKRSESKGAYCIATVAGKL